MIVKIFICVFLHFGIAFGLMALAYLIYPFSYHWAVGLFLYLGVTCVVYRIIPKKHIEGVNNLIKGEYDAAFKNFEESFQFFTKYSFIDTYGFIFLLNMSDCTYRESALLNQAFIKYKQGNEDEARDLYEKVLRLNAKNRMAKKGIRTLA